MAISVAMLPPPAARIVGNPSAPATQGAGIPNRAGLDSESFKACALPCGTMAQSPDCSLVT